MNAEHSLRDDGKDKGWISLYRELLHNPICQDAYTLQLFIYGSLRASYKPEEIIIEGKLVTLTRGQFIFGIESASKHLKMSTKRVRSRTDLLIRLGIWARQRAGHYSIITVCNYDEDQSPRNQEGRLKGNHREDGRATYNKENNIYKEDIIGRSNKQTDPRVKEFFDFWRETFQQKTGQPYVFSLAKEGKLIKDVLKVHSMRTIWEATRLFFTDEQSKRRGLTIGIFFQEINRLLSQKAMDPLEQAKREQRAKENVYDERA